MLIKHNNNIICAKLKFVFLEDKSNTTNLRQNILEWTEV